MPNLATPVASPPRKLRKRWYVIGVSILFLLATPFAVFYGWRWWEEEKLDAMCREMDAEDPAWRWPDLIAQLPAPPPDEENAAVQFLKVESLLKLQPFNLGPKWVLLEEAEIVPNLRLSDEQAEDLRKGFSRLGPTVLKEARRLKDMPNGRLPIDPVEEGDLLRNTPNMAREVLEVYRLLEYDVALSLQDQNMSEAADSCHALLNTAHAIGDHPNIVAQQNRMIGQRIAIGAIERTLAQGELSAEELQRLQTAMALEAAHEGLYHALRSARAADHQFYLAVGAGKTSPAKLFVSLRLSTPKLYNVFPHLLNLETHAYPQHLRLRNEMIRVAKRPDPGRSEAIFASAHKAPNLLSVILMVRARETVTFHQRSQALLRCGILALAAERHRLETGHWPRELKELTLAGLPAETRTDPYTGEPLRWKRTDAGVIVYSVGPQKVDSGHPLGRGPSPRVSTVPGFELWAPPHRHLPAKADPEKPNANR